MDDSWKLTDWEFLIDSQWIPITWIERRLGSKRKSSIFPTLTFCLLLSLSVYLPLLYSLNFSLSVYHSLHAVVFQPQVPPWQFQTAEAQQVYSLAAWPPLTPTSNTNTDMYKYKTKYDRNTPLSRKSMLWRI